MDANFSCNLSRRRYRTCSLLTAACVRGLHSAQADFLRSWVRSLYDPHYEALSYPPGLQVNNLSCVLK